MNREPRMRALLGVVAAGAALVAALPVATGAPRQSDARAARVTSIATLTTRDFRVAVVARRLNGGATPTAEVRVRLAQRAGGRWRDLGERRLDDSYFWHVVRGPRAVCRLAIATAGARSSFRPYVTLQLLVSPSLGCGRAYRLPLAAR